MPVHTDTERKPDRINKGYRNGQKVAEGCVWKNDGVSEQGKALPPKHSGGQRRDERTKLKLKVHLLVAGLKSCYI